MLYIAIDLGATNVRIAASESLQEVNFGKIRKEEIRHDFEKDLALIISAIKSFSGEIKGIGFGVPGTLNPGKDTIISATNLPEWENINIREKISKEFGALVFFENDAAGAALGEAIYGKQEKKDFIYLTWGTGIGGALVNFAGDKISAGKIYWEKYLKDFEQQCGGRCLQSRFGRPADELETGDWNIVMEDFYKNIVWLSEELNCQQIVIGGGIAIRQENNLHKLADRLAKRGIRFSLTHLGENIGLYGALAVIKNNQ